MRRTRLSLAALVVASSAVLGLPTTALGAPAEATDAPPISSAAETTAPAVEEVAEPAASGDAEGAVPAPTEAPVIAAPSTIEQPAVTEAPAAAEVPVTAAAAPSDVPVQVLSINDLHGRYAPQAGSDGTLADPYTSPASTLTVGGLQHLAAVLDAQRLDFAADNPGTTPDAESNSLFVSVGDNVGASPFESAFFGDEPTIQLLDELGLQVSAVGNHEFDRGLADLLRTSAATDQYEASLGTEVKACPATLGGEPFVPTEDGCFTPPDGSTFDGADFPLLAANVTYTAGPNAGEPILPPYVVFDVPNPAGGFLKLGMVGVVTTTTPQQVVPTGVANLTFGDEVAALDRYSAELHTEGVDAVVALVHEGGTQSAATAPATAGYSDCAGNLAGQRIGTIAAQTSPLVDVLVTGHSHVPYLCTINDPAGQPRQVTQAGFYGKAVTDLRFSISPLTGEIDRTGVTSTNVPVARTGSDAAVQALSDGWLAEAATEGNVPVGSIAADVTRSANRDRESSLGNLVADSQLEALRADPLYDNPVIAFMNPGGLRTDLTYAPDGQVTYREVFNVQPFSNFVNAVTMTGAQIHQLLEQQFVNPAGRATQLLLSTSAGFSYTYDPTADYGQHINPCSITLDGTVLDPAGSYRVAANSFLTAGGDAFTAFTEGTDLVPGPLDADTFRAYIAAHSPVAPPTTDRIAVSETPFTCAVADGGDTDNEGGSAAPVAPDDGGSADVRGVVGSGSGRGSSYASLAYTGAPVTEMLTLGGVLLAAGGALTAAGYRRRRGLAQ